MGKTVKATATYYQYIINRLSDTDKAVLAEKSLDESIFKELEEYIVSNFKRGSSADNLLTSFMRSKKLRRLKGTVQIDLHIIADHMFNHLQRKSLQRQWEH